ncbi:MAG: hypothetical protein ACI81V_000968 [Lentimonas sp.]|jgi:hypothetical protein
MRAGDLDWDIVQNQLLWNERMFEMYGARPEDFSGAYQVWFDRLVEGDSGRVQGDVEAAIVGIRDYNTEFPDPTCGWRRHTPIIRCRAGRPR